MSPPLNNTADPVERTSSPYPNPYEIGPKSKILSSRTSNYHSTSLRNMVTVNTVNKTALHPGGVQYVQFGAVTVTRRPQNSSPKKPLLTQLPGQ
jgi:phosphoenolpyruvate carboxykinase (ATP)